MRIRIKIHNTERVPHRKEPSVVDRHRFDADPDHNFQVDVDQYPNRYPDSHQNDDDPHANPTKFYTCWKIRKFTALPVYNVLPFSSVSKHRCHNFSYFHSIWNFGGKQYSLKTFSLPWN
jgi:hypothetical protein